MTKLKITPEQEAAQTAMHQRQLKFVDCMSRVAMPGSGTIDDTCSCCGYPYLYYDVDFWESCVICEWGPNWDDDDTVVYLRKEQRDVVTSLVESRVQFEATGGCLGGVWAPEREPSHMEARRQLVDALDALAADNDPAKDVGHWRVIRARFNAVAFFVWPNPGRRLRFAWQFAIKVDGAEFAR